MSKKKVTEPVSEEVIPENMVQIDMTNVVAATIKNLGILALPAADVVADYSHLSMAVSLDEDSNMIVFELVENKDIPTGDSNES